MFHKKIQPSQVRNKAHIFVDIIFPNHNELAICSIIDGNVTWISFVTWKSYHSYKTNEQFFIFIAEQTRNCSFVLLWSHLHSHTWFVIQV